MTELFKAVEKTREEMNKQTNRNYQMKDCVILLL